MMSDNNWVHYDQKPDKLEYVNAQIELRAQYEALLVLKLFTRQELEQKINEINNFKQMLEQDLNGSNDFIQELEQKINKINNSKHMLEQKLSVLEQNLNGINDFIQKLEQKINEANYSIRAEIGCVSSNKKIKPLVKIEDIKPILEQKVKIHACESCLSKEQQKKWLQDITSIFKLDYAQKLMQKRAELEQKLVGASNFISDETYEPVQKNNKEFLQYLFRALDYLKVKEDGMALQDVKEELITKELCEIAVKQNGMALQFVPIKYRKVDLCGIAIQQNSDAIQYVPENIQSISKFNKKVNPGIYLGR